MLERVEHGETSIYVVEVFYSEDGTILGWTEKEEVWGEDVEGVRTCLGHMAAALEHPVLNEADLLAEAEARGHLEPLGTGDSYSLSEFLEMLDAVGEDD